jgi:hypothetical protein
VPGVAGRARLLNAPAGSIAIGTGLTENPPGAASLEMVADDIHVVRAELVGRGLEVSEVDVQP